APQDYRDGDESLFKAMCFAEYRGFFYIGMITRNERNAIIQHGTMTIIRRDVLQAVGAWAPWCITEDAELGLRIFEHGWQSAYLPASYGRGLMPDTFTDYKKQRARWAFGAMQIVRRHFKELFGLRKTKLNTGQRYHFLAGWLPWLADGFNLLFNLAALGWSFAMIAWPRTVDPPLVMFSILPLCLFGFKIAKLLHLYLTRVGAGWRQTLGAALAGLALTHAIGVAMLSGLVRRSKPFVRTPKQAPRHALLAALFEAREETLLACALLLCAWGVAQTHNMALLDVLVWVSVLLMQCIPYAASWLLSLISGLRLPAGVLGKTQTMRSSEQHVHAKDKVEQAS
ncbi:MAG TPA: glycosyltransferase family 2 protein, partial [Gammaproteobacteria bacterium]|nr:glycosyltransferase family 2 protein [Gammaproteobacteria bacterium]